MVDAPVQEEPPVPDYWRIDAPIPNYEEIYGEDSAVVEMEYSSLEDDVVVYDHTTDSPAAVFPPPRSLSPILCASQHLVAAPSCSGAQRGRGVFRRTSRPFGARLHSHASADWSGAARSFQRMAASMPGSAEVFNNYGVSLLQRAVSMRDGGDEQQRSMADAV